jgi:hypothetical protein
MEKVRLWQTSFHMIWCVLFLTLRIVRFLMESLVEHYLPYITNQQSWPGCINKAKCEGLWGQLLQKVTGFCWWHFCISLSPRIPKSEGIEYCRRADWCAMMTSLLGFYWNFNGGLIAMRRTLTKQMHHIFASWSQDPYGLLHWALNTCFLIKKMNDSRTFNCKALDSIPWDMLELLGSVISTYW